VNYAEGTAISVTAGDFNRDGNPDLAVANGSDNNVSILLGIGDGTFNAAVNYAVGTYPRSVNAGDFNRDGKPDLAVANQSSGNVSVLTGNGDGTFNAAVNYAAGTNPRSVTAGDFNRDGKPDLAVANRGSNNVSVLLNTSPEIDVSGNGNSIADGDTTPSTADGTDFGNADISTGTVDRTFTITNNGDTALNLSGTPIISLAGDTTEFTVTDSPVATIAVGGNDTFTITFDPTSVGAKTATVSIASNDSNENPYDFTIQGTGVTPEINLKEGVTDIADGGSYDFGSQLLSTDTDVTFTIENLGTIDLTMTTPISIGGADAGQFSIQAQPTSPVAASGSTTFTVRFTPTSTGAKTANISITNDDSDENPYNLTIQGTATTPEINLKEGVTDIADDGSYDFGSHLLSTDTDVTFTIENTGTADLTMTTPLTIGGVNADQFSIQTQPTSPVAASGSTTFVIRLTPTSEGVKTATISIANNDSDENPYVLTITGTGFEEEDDHYLDVNLLDTGQRVTISDSGRLRQTLEVTSADGKLTVNIPSGTRAKQENGNRLTTLDVSENDNPPPPPENKNIIGLTYSFEPSGATFDPPITLTFTYNHIDIPEGVSEEDLVLAFYDEDTGKWIELECVVDIDNHTINAMLSHFTDFAIIAPVQQPPPTTPQPEPAPAAFSLSKLTIQPLEVEPEEMVTISVSVSNTGGTKGSYTVVLNVNDIEEQKQSISVATGGTEQVDFTVGKEVPGDYSIKIGSLEGTFTVMVPEEPAETPVEEVPQQPELPTEPSVPTEKGGINWYIIGTIIGIAVLLAIFIPIWVRSRRVS